MTRPDDNRRDRRIYGDGFNAKTPIEGAARQGWLDACAGQGFSPEWEAETPQWQRNYEAGRQWAVAVLSVGLEPTDWPEGARVPQPLLDQLAKVRAVTGCGTRPEDFNYDRPPDDPAPLRAMVPVVTRRGRIVERLTR